MSANVWFEEVNIALVKLLRDTIKIKSNTGANIPIPPNSVMVRRPEDEFKMENFPCVSIYNTGYRRDLYRGSTDPVVVVRDELTNTATVEDPSVPFTLNYQIDFWAKYQEDMDLMTRSWLFKYNRQFALPVIDDGGTLRYCNVNCSNSIVKSDLVQNKERLFHSIISISIWVELDDENRYNVSMVTKINT